MTKHECFCDESYYGYWAVRPVGEKRWGYCYHLPSKEEAEGLVKELDGLHALRAALTDATLSLECIARDAGRSDQLDDELAIREYADSRAAVAREALEKTKP
jgi:hypothetical protein